jgi:ABC-type uncharacterized transport system involved in gliding motility auxiliary subunit
MLSALESADRRTLAVGGLALAAVFVLALHVFSQLAFRGIQIDLTEDSVYTLSQGTREVLAAVKEPVTLRFFVSPELVEQSPGLNNYAKSVQELLERYVALSNENLKLEIIHPEPFSPEEDRAVGFGLQGVPLTQAGNLGYFGLAGTNTTDDLDVIPFFTLTRERFLEYDLSRLIQNLDNPKKKKIGLVGSLPIMNDPIRRYRPWYIVKQMRQFFDVERVTLEDPIPDDIDVLMVVHPRDMDDTDRYYIDQYVVAGGRTMIFLDPFSEEATRGNSMQRQGPDTGSELDKLFKAWGIVFDKNKVLGDRQAAQRVSAGKDALGRPVITDYLAWLTMTSERLARGDVITGELEQINLASSGFIDKAEGAEIKFEPLIVSSKDSMAMAVSTVNKDPSPTKMLKDFKSANRSFNVAARISGMLKSAFPDGPPEDKMRAEIAEARRKKGEEVPVQKPHLKQSAQPANLIVVADVDMLADSFWVQTQNFFGQQVVVPIANNGDFVINALDNLAGSNALISLRGRGVTSRPFHTVEAIQKEAELRYRSKEQGLLDKLKEVEARLKDLQTKEKPKGKGQAVILSAEQKAAIDKFRQQSITTRKELREVQLALRRDIDRLDGLLKLINIGLVPALIVIFAIVLGLVRRAAAQRHRAAAQAH